MNLRHLSYLVALAREEHFGRAAQAVHVTQPALSAAIRQLEDELAVPLVLRSRQRFRGLTAEGREVLSRAQRILADCSALLHSLEEIKGSLKGDLRIGVIPTAEPRIARLTRALRERYPGISVTLASPMPRSPSTSRPERSRCTSSTTVSPAWRRCCRAEAGRSPGAKRRRCRSAC